MTYWLGNIGDLHRFTAIYRDYTLKGFDLVADQIATNTAQAVNFVRSAIAPEMRAGVMIANIN